MARQVKNAEKWHRFTIHEKHSSGADSELILTGTGRAAYLWFGRKESGRWYPGYVSGPVTLRKLAYAILKEVGK